MTERVLGPTGSPRRRWTLLLPLVAVIALGLLYVTGAQAVHDYSNGMQLDGDVSNACPPAPDTGVCTSGQADWADFFDVSGGTTTPKATLPNTDFKKATFVRDFESGTTKNNCTLASAGTTFCTGDASTFATGSKDTLDIANGGWQCNRDNNVNSKIDIMNAYAASYTASNGDKIMYFGLEKNKDNGTNDVGFWFLQGTASCTAPANGAANWTGSNHTVGDVLVVSEFTSGGGVSNITAYKWVGGSNPLSQIASATGAGGDCKTALAADNLCATTNSGAKKFNTTLTTPWLTSDATLGVGNAQIVPPDFFEGGINLTKAFSEGGGGTAPSCFNTFVGDTRSSATTTSTLFDYASGQLGECKTTLTTQANAAQPLSIGTGTVSSGTDTATLVITGTPSWGGDLTWWLCGPIASPALCDKTKGVEVTSRTVSNSSPAADFISGTKNLTSVGRYCWTSHFEPDTATKAAGVAADDDDGVNECFTVSPVAPTLATLASCSADPCVLGSTLSDTSTLVGTATQPGTNGGNTDYPSIGATNGAAAAGTINWTLYGPASGGCSVMKATSPTSVTVSGDRDGVPAADVYGPTSYTTLVSDGTGTYTFVATYTGNLPNTTAPTTAMTCATAPNVEKVTVTGTASIVSKQRWLPNDTVTLTGSTNLTGTLTITLYPTIDCTGTAVTGQSYSPPVSNAASGSTFTTNNTTFFVGTNPDGTAGGAAGSYSWLVHYDDNNLTDPADHCEKSTLSPITD